MRFDYALGMAAGYTHILQGLPTFKTVLGIAETECRTSQRTNYTVLARVSVQIVCQPQASRNKSLLIARGSGSGLPAW